jgi:hypothetical protein
VICVLLSVTSPFVLGLFFVLLVLGNTLIINATLISEVTGIPLTNGKAVPYLHTEP